MLFYILCTTRKCSEVFGCNLFGVTGIFFILWSDYYRNLECFHTKITYLEHTREAIVISNKNNEQHMQKVGIAHSCYEIRHPRSIFSWEGHFWPQKDLGSIFAIYLQKISQSTKYFVCYLYSYLPNVKQDHLSLIKKYTMLQWLIYPPSLPRSLQSKMTHIVMMRVKNCSLTSSISTGFLL